MRRTDNSARGLIADDGERYSRVLSRIGSSGTNVTQDTDARYYTSAWHTGLLMIIWIVSSNELIGAPVFISMTTLVTRNKGKRDGIGQQQVVGVWKKVWDASRVVETLVN